MSALVAVTYEVISFSKTDFINTPLLTNIGKTRFVFFSGTGPGFVLCVGFCLCWKGMAWQPCTDSWNMGPSPPMGTSAIVEVEGSQHLRGEETASALPSGADSSPWGQIPEELSCETGHGHSSGHQWAGGMKPNWEGHHDEQGSEEHILAMGADRAGLSHARMETGLLLQTHLGRMNKEM